MSIIFAQNLAKYYGGQDVFSQVEFSVSRGDKIALVGPNGAGKTTLLRIILGLEEPTDGLVQRASGLRMGYLPQVAEFPSDRTVYTEMLEVFRPLRDQERALLALTHEMSKAADPTQLMERYTRAEQRFELAGGYTYENRIARVLMGLGFGPDTYEWPISLLSGGQVTRALLAKLLLQEPEILILDEPTNYLDLAALEWVEGYLQSWPNSILLVSHDRYFLDKVVSRVWELNHGRLDLYRGNYTSYVAQRHARRERQLREYEDQQELIAKTEEYIRRYRAGQRGKEARGRETRLERMERIAPPPADRQIHLQLPAVSRTGDNVLMSDGVTIGYESRPETVQQGEGNGQTMDLFDTGSFLIRRGQRIALLGANGAGKTTFLRAILGEVEPLAGYTCIGASVRVGYLPQSQDWLDPDKTVLEQLLDASDLRVAQARNLLARFLFVGEEVFKETANLSGGERSRLALALLSLGEPNFLLLDEPTTHLDVESQEVLQEVLADYEGTILFVSHDRYLIDRLATHIWYIHDGCMEQYEGNYSAYQEEVRRRQEALAENAEVPRPSQSDDQRGEDERLAQRRNRWRVERAKALEAEISEMERMLSEMSELIEQASAARELARLHSLSQEYREVQEALTERMQQWEQLADPQGE
ncbi:MAG: hypothetical protein A2Y73_06810 [Chloroflexi bacterium RBG_13_56_8]|nr:MAG: hypothetical protein A2Y73_06810 [Chloroflexi bacterium RBG_13_56_8]